MAQCFPYERTKWGSQAESRYLGLVQGVVETVAEEPVEFAGRIDALRQDFHMWQPVFTGSEATYSVFMYEDQQRQGLRIGDVYVVAKTGGSFKYLRVSQQTRDERISEAGRATRPDFVVPAMDRLIPEFTVAEGFLILEAALDR